MLSLVFQVSILITGQLGSILFFLPLLQLHTCTSHRYMHTLYHLFIIVWNRQKIVLEMMTLLSIIYLSFNGRNFFLLGSQECSYQGMCRDRLYLWPKPRQHSEEDQHTHPSQYPLSFKNVFPYRILFYCHFIISYTIE